MFSVSRYFSLSVMRGWMCDSVILGSVSFRVDTKYSDDTQEHQSFPKPSVQTLKFIYILLNCDRVLSEF